MHIPYFYIIRHTKSNKLYAGSRWLKGCHPNELLQINGYQTSSTKIKSQIKLEGLESFEILRIDTYCDNLHPYDYETLFLQTIDCANSDEWYNNHNNNSNIKQSDEIRQKIKQTNLIKYGVENAIQNKDIRKIAQKTKLSIYGNYNNIEKIKQTNLIKYGVENVFQLKSTKEKIKQTNLIKYGVQYSSQSKIVIDKIKESNKNNHNGLHNGQVQIICPHCNKIGATSGMQLSHFDNCKYNKITPIKEFICPYCNKIGKNKGSMMTHHFDNCKSNPLYVPKIKNIAICHYCNKSSTNIANMRRYHFDNCKYK